MFLPAIADGLSSQRPYPFAVAHACIRKKQKNLNTRLFDILFQNLVLLLFMMAAPCGVWGMGPLANDSLPENTADAARAADSVAMRAISVANSVAMYADTLATGRDSVSQAKDDSLQIPAKLALTEADHRMLKAKRENKLFVPDPNRAVWLSLVFPGGGQIYNRKYWKLPIFYGGFLGCFYAFTWNQQMYMDYSQAYLDIMDDNPDTNSYLDMFPPSYDIDNNVERFKTVFKNRKDRFRRWRDLSAFCFVGVYLLSVVDAYVDAHLSAFDISDDLSLQLSPTAVSTPGSGNTGYGLGAILTF